MPIPDPPEYAVNWTADPRVVASGVPFRITVYLTYRGETYGGRPHAWQPQIRFASSDPNAVLPAPYTYVPADRGFETFTITLYATGSQTLTVTAPGAGPFPATPTGFIPGGYASSQITMTVQNEYLLTIRGETLPVAGVPYNYTVSCIKNSALVTDGSWLPRVIFDTEGDDGAAFEPAYTFVPADRGVKVIPVTFSVDSNRVLLKVSDQISGGAYSGELMVSEYCTLVGEDAITVQDGVTFNYVLSTKIGGVYQSAVRWLPNVYVTSSDPAATLLGGSPYQYVAADAVEAGYTFTLILNTPGIHTLDFVANDPNGFPTRKTVTATVTAVATKLTATAIRTSGRNTQISIAATDAAGDTDLTVTGNVSIASTNPAFVNSVATTTTAALVAGQVLVTVNSATANTLTISKAGLTSATVRIV